MHLPRVLPTVRCDAVHQPGRAVPGADEAATHAVVQVGYAEWALLVEATGDVDACVADPKADWPATALPLIQLFFWDARRRLGSFPHAQAAAG
jgi:hypothetical protein